MSFSKILAAVGLAGAVFLSSVASFAADKLKSGTFRGNNGVPTSGSVSVVKNGSKQQIIISGNFKTKKGPALFVYVGNGSPSKRIGKLKSIKGGQSYTLPSSVDIKKYSNIYIYCKPFKKTFGTAKLK